MRTDVKVAALSLAVILGACDKRQEQTTGLSEDLKRDLAAASAAGDLATAPNAFKPARFVSSVEMSRSTKPTPRLVASKRRTPKAIRAEAVDRPASDVVADPSVKAEEADAPAPTPVDLNAPAESAPVVIVQEPTPEPTPVSLPSNAGSGDEGRGDGRSIGEGGIGERRPGGGIAGTLGGIIGAVVIRGGHGGVDKCDPRTDGRRGRGGIISRRPDFGMPSPVGRGTFPTL